jgi:hypothetical protein
MAVSTLDHDPIGVYLGDAGCVGSCDCPRFLVDRRRRYSVRCSHRDRALGYGVGDRDGTFGDRVGDRDCRGQAAGQGGSTSQQKPHEQQIQ